MPKKIIITAVIVIVYLFSPIPSMALKGLKETKAPDDLNSGLDHLLKLASLDNKDTFDLRSIEKVLFWEKMRIGIIFIPKFESFCKQLF